MINVKVATLMLFSAALTILVLFGFSINTNNDRIIDRYCPVGEGCAEMPIVLDSQPHKAHRQFAPEEQRGLEVREYLAPSIKIRTSGGSGSGTIIYYDHNTGWAYVASCGHLWSGSRTYNETQREIVIAKIITWYHNEIKLNKSKSYDAEVLFWSNERGYDSSCLRFKPDWEPEYFPIASANYKFTQGMKLHSTGCDGAKEVAHYEVEFVEFRGNDLITRRNSPRPGRSGGGLLSTDGWYVGTCWGTSNTRTGGGVGYFTPLKSIHNVYFNNGHDWLLRGVFAQQIPIRDWLNPYQKYGREYIPLPSGNKVPLWP